MSATLHSDSTDQFDDNPHIDTNSDDLGFHIEEKNPLSEKLGFLALEFKGKCIKELAEFNINQATVHQLLELHVVNLLVVQADYDKEYKRQQQKFSAKIQQAEKKLKSAMSRIANMETKIKLLNDDRHKASKELKQSEFEHKKVIEEGRVTEEKLKQVEEKAEQQSTQLTQAKKKNKTLQKELEELQKETEALKSDKHRKSENSGSNADVRGLQTGLDRAKTQLKKKQEECQIHNQTLQQRLAKIKSLEFGRIDDGKTIEGLQKQIRIHTTNREADRVEMNSLRVELQVATSQMAKIVLEERKTFELEKDFRREIEAQLNLERAQSARILAADKDNITKLQEKIDRLETRISDIFDKADYELLDDEDISDRIRLRNLLDQAQERLATIARLKPSGPGEVDALTWRLALGPSIETAERVETAKKLVAGKPIDEFDRAFITNSGAFKLMCQLYSRFRQPANNLHQLLSRDGYMLSVQRYLKYNPNDTAGDSLVAIVNYVCRTAPFGPSE